MTRLIATLILVATPLVCPPDTDLVGWIKTQSHWGETCSGYIKTTLTVHGDFLLWSSVTPTDCFVISGDNGDVLKICETGEVTVRGKRITDDREVYRLLKRTLNGQCCECAVTP